MKENINIEFWKTPFGELILGSFNDELCLCDWRYRTKRNAIDQRIQKGLETSFVEKSTPIIDEAKLQLQEYFKGERKTFSIPLRLVGTPFQQSVWKELQQIKFGSTETYLGLSQRLNNEKAIRAVASANGANALSILIPCHRIIGADNRLVGYAGGVNAKKKLLDLEGGINKNQLNLFE